MMQTMHLAAMAMTLRLMTSFAGAATPPEWVEVRRRRQRTHWDIASRRSKR